MRPGSRNGPVSPTRVAAPDAPEPRGAGGGGPCRTRLAAPRPRRKLARALSDAALALQSEHDPMRILGVMAEQMSRVVPVTEMAIFVADYETFRLVPVLATGPDRDEIMADSMALDAGITGWAFAKGTPQNIPDTSKHPLARQIPGTVVRTRNHCCWCRSSRPSTSSASSTAGGSAVDQFSASELEAASLFAHVAASAWRNAQLYGELVNAAMTDPLTGLYNSRWLRDAGERDIARAARDGKPLSLLLVDLDHFKAVNDSSGHAIGDVVLQRVAAQLRTTVRGADAVVRLGGEEFVVLLHECSAEGAWVAAEAVRARGSRRRRCRRACSLDGPHRFHRHRDVPRARAPPWISCSGAADRAMYSAKHEGRDRSVSATPSPGRAGRSSRCPAGAHRAPAARSSSPGAEAGSSYGMSRRMVKIHRDSGEEQSPAEQYQPALERGERVSFPHHASRQ